MSIDDLAEVGARVRAYLEASSSGRWEAAAAYVAPSARFGFPTGTYASLEGLRDGLVRRYRGLVKHVESTDVAASADGTVVVVVSGTLAGHNLHGVAFDGVRFLDRLVLRDGLIVEQHIYNDLASSNALDRRASGTAFQEC